MTQPYQYNPQQQFQAGPTYAAPQQPQPGAGQALAAPVPQLGQATGAAGGNVTPQARHLHNRTVILIPKGIDENNMRDGKVAPKATYDLVVVDGGDIAYGDSQDRDPSKQRPNTHVCATPARFDGAGETAQYIVAAVREALAAGEAGRVGVVQRGTKGRLPYLFTKCSTDVDGAPRPDGDARFAAAMQVWEQIHNRTFVNPAPRSLVAPPSQPAQQVSYQAPAPQAYPGAPASFNQQAAAAGAQAGLYPVNFNPYASQQPAAAPVSAPSAFVQAAQPELQRMAQQLPEAVEAWIASLPPEQQALQRQSMLAQMAAQAGAAPAGPGI